MRAVIILSVLGFFSACGTESKCGPSTGTVDYVVDGDTVDLATGVRIRLLLVDTPETTNGRKDCYGQEAKQFTTETLAGKDVELTYDESSCTDKYGRTLAYVKVKGGVEINSELVKHGYACTLFIPPAGTSRDDEFEDYEAEARTDRTGLWGACSEVLCDK